MNATASIAIVFDHHISLLYLSMVKQGFDFNKRPRLDTKNKSLINHKYILKQVWFSLDKKRKVRLVSLREKALKMISLFQAINN